MTPAQFITWLNRFLELSTEPTLSEKQLKVIKDKLKKAQFNMPEVYVNEVSKCSCWQNGLTYCPIHGRKNGWCEDPTQQPPKIIG
jgi:hypothetical protein